MGRSAGDSLQEKADSVGACTGVYICDLADEITEGELRQVFQNYGEVASLEYDKEAASARVRFAEADAAEEAQSTLNYALLKGRTCRCLLTNVVQVIRGSMESGQRLVVEGLDPSVESPGLRDVCSLFGPVLDCKVELDDGEQSRGFGFVHYGDKEGATKAMEFMDGMQIGTTPVELRVYEPADMGLFTGCTYVSSEEAASEQAQAAAVEEERQRQAMNIFASLRHHYVEVVESTEAKLQRLKALIEDYGPDHERQMLVVAGAIGVQATASVVRQSCEETDYAALEADVSERDLRVAAEGFLTGNLYILVLAIEIAMGDTDFNTAAVLVNMDFPRTLPLYLQRIRRRADKDTRVHSFFSPRADVKLTRPLMSLLEDAGHDIPAVLADVGTKAGT